MPYDYKSTFHGSSSIDSISNSDEESNIKPKKNNIKPKNSKPVEQKVEQKLEQKKDNKTDINQYYTNKHKNKYIHYHVYSYFPYMMITVYFVLIYIPSVNLVNF